MQRHLIIGAMLALVAGASACSAAPAQSPVTEAEARAMAERMLAAYNDGDYAAWSADWSQAMKDAIGEEAFNGFRQQTMTAAGEFVAIESVEMRPGQNPGVVRWEFATAFENETYTFMLAFKDGSKLIEGVNLAPPGHDSTPTGASVPEEFDGERYRGVPAAGGPVPCAPCWQS